MFYAAEPPQLGFADSHSPELTSQVEPNIIVSSTSAQINPQIFVSSEMVLPAAVHTGASTQSLDPETVGRLQDGSAVLADSPSVMLSAKSSTYSK